jgi:hypothetical protein
MAILEECEIASSVIVNAGHAVEGVLHGRQNWPKSLEERASSFL